MKYTQDWWRRYVVRNKCVSRSWLSCTCFYACRWAKIKERKPFMVHFPIVSVLHGVKQLYHYASCWWGLYYCIGFHTDNLLVNVKMLLFFGHFCPQGRLNGPKCLACKNGLMLLQVFDPPAILQLIWSLRWLITGPGLMLCKIFSWYG